MPVPVFATRLRELRTQKNITQKQAAIDLNINPSVLTNYENGIREPHFETLLRISEYFNVSTDYLLGKSNFKENPQMEINESFTELNMILSKSSEDESEAALSYLDSALKIVFSCYKSNVMNTLSGYGEILLSLENVAHDISSSSIREYENDYELFLRNSDFNEKNNSIDKYVFTNVMEDYIFEKDQVKNQIRKTCNLIAKDLDFMTSMGSNDTFITQNGELF